MPMGPIQKEMVQVEKRAIAHLKANIGRNIREIIRAKREGRDAEQLRREVTRQKKNFKEQVAEFLRLCETKFDHQPLLRGHARGVEKLKKWLA